MKTLARRSEALAADTLLPSATPLQLIDADGHPGDNPGSLSLPGPDVLVELHRRRSEEHTSELQSPC